MPEVEKYLTNGHVKIQNTLKISYHVLNDAIDRDEIWGDSIKDDTFKGLKLSK